MEIKKNINKILRTRLWILILIFIIIFLTINITRVSTSAAFPNADSTIFMNDLTSYKSFNNEGFNLFYETIIELSFILSETITIILILLTLGIINMILFDKVSKHIIKNEIDRTLAICLFVLSNIFLFSIIGFTYLSILITLALWTTLVTIRNPKIIFIPLIAALLINFELFIFILILSIVLFILTKSKYRIYKILEEQPIKPYAKRAIIIPGIILIVMYIYNSVTIRDIFLSRINFSNTLFSTGQYAISLIYIALAIFALFAEIKDKKLMILTFVLLLTSWINIYLSLILLFIIIFSAAIGIRHIIQRRWFVKELRTPVIFLLMLLFLFMSINFVQTTINSGPSQPILNDIQVMDNFKAENLNNNIIFCDIRDCEIIELYSNQNVYYSSLHYTNKDNHIEKLNFTETILQNTNLKVMEKFFEENNISTVFISKEALNEKWIRSDQGILLLLTQSNKFVKINETTASHIYYYTGNIDESEE